ncbi:hypothetical protein HDU76_007592, partial [Blyttiomyces sp. JEL0837]
PEDHQRPVPTPSTNSQINGTGLPVAVAGGSSSSGAATTSQSLNPAPTNDPASNGSTSSANPSAAVQSVPRSDEHSDGIYVQSGSNSFRKLNDRQLDQLGKQLMVRVIKTDITQLNESHIDLNVVEGKLIEELQRLSPDKWKCEQQ